MSLLARVSWVAGATVVHSALALLLSMLLARSLGPSGRGIYAIVTLTALLAGAFGTLGLSTGATIRAGRQPASASGLLTASLILAAGAGSLLCLAVNSLALIPGLRVFADVSPKLVFIGSLAIPSVMLSTLLTGILAGLGGVARAAWLGTFSAAIQVALTTSVVLRHPDPLEWLLGVFAVGPAVLCLMLLAELRRHTRLRLKDPRADLRGVVLFSLKSHLANVVHLLHMRLDIFVVKVFLSPREVGLYALAQAVCEWIWLLPRSTAMTLMPAVASSTSEMGIAYTARASRLMLLLAGGATVALAAVADWLIPFFFGRAFAGSAGPLRVLLPGIWAGSATGILSAYLTGVGRAGYPLVNTVLSTSANLVLNLILVPRYGITGAAVASTITYSLSLLMNVIFVCRVASVPVRDLVIARRSDLDDIWRTLLLQWERRRIRDTHRP